MTAPERSWRDLPSHKAWLTAEALSLLDFARGSKAEAGFGWLGDRGELVAGHPQPLWLSARMTHVFALGVLMGQPGCAPLCDHGVRAFSGAFADREHDGWHAELHQGRPSGGNKDAFTLAFTILGLSSATCAARPGAREELAHALGLVERHFWREDEGAVCEGYDPSWRTREAYRGANGNMHAVEAFLAAADALGEDRWRGRALRICDRLINRVARANDWRVIEHFDAAWRPAPDYNTDARDHPFRPFGHTPGHGFEWARLLLNLRASLADPPPWLLEASQGLFARAADDGWAAPGGFVYTTDGAGAPVVDRRLHWVVTEAIGAAAVLHEATGEPEYEAWYRRAWDFADAHLRDRTHGSWRHELDAELKPADGAWPGKPDIYHAFQATLIPRLPLAGSLAGALRDGALRG